MKIAHIIRAVCLFLPLCSQSQSTIDEVLISIATNNPELKASMQLAEARNLEARTGINPSNPSISYDYMYGSPVTAGNQTDFMVVQGFDFPSAYGHKKQMATDQQNYTNAQVMRTKQALLLESQEICLQLIGGRQKLAWLAMREERTNRLKLDLDQKVKGGEATILDLNKAQLAVLSIQKEISEVNRKQAAWTQRLTELNGGVPVIFSETEYPLQENVPPFESMLQTYYSMDPLLVSLHKEVEMQQTNIALTKSLALPKMEAGYHYQGILGQTFQGFHLGLTIPLWEHRNAVKASQSQSNFTQANLWSHELRVASELRVLYDRYDALRSFLAQYQSAMSGLNELVLLDKSLALGQISAITYFMEEAFYAEAQANLLSTQLETQLVQAAIQKCNVLSIK